MSYIGNTVENQNYVPAVDYFNGDGSTVAFTLSRPVASVAAVQAVISNVPQNPGSAFTVSGSTITFTSAPPSGTANIYVYYTSPNTQVVQPGQGTVGTTQLATDLTLTNPTYTGTLTGGTGVVNIGSGQFYKDSNGYVGIGTSNPSRHLQINATLPVLQLTNPTTGTTSGDGTLLYQNAANFTIEQQDNGYVNVLTGGSERMRIDSSGRVTTPYQPAFRVRMSTNGNTSVTNGSVFPFDTVMYNIGSNFNTSTYRFTAPVAGVYAFSYHSYKNGSGTPSLIAARVNTNALFRTRMDGTNDMVIVASFSCYLSANDYVDVVNDSGVTFVAYDNTSGSYTSFEGYLVG